MINKIQKILFSIIILISLTILACSTSYAYTFEELYSNGNFTNSCTTQNLMNTLNQCGKNGFDINKNKSNVTKFFETSATSMKGKEFKYAINERISL